MHCHCRGQLDPWGGDHLQPAQLLGCCSGPSRLKGRLARVCREAGARVAQNVRLADMNLDASVQDARRIEVVCNGLPLWHGAQLAVDAAIVSPVGRTGEPRAGADARPALALDQAAQRKRRHTYPELERARRCPLVVFGVEVGGRWSHKAAQFVRVLARARAAAAPAALRVTARGAWMQRWNGILSVAAQRAFATSLLELPLHGDAKAAALSLNCMRSLRTHAGLQLLPQAVSRHTQREQTHAASKACAGTGVWDELREKGA